MKLDLLLPHLRTGGIESGLVRLAPELLARGFTVRFVLQSGDGELRDALPAQVNVVALNAGGMLATARAYASLLRKKPSDVVYSATNALNVSQLLAARLLGSKAPVAVIGEHIPLSVFLASRKRPWLRRALMRLLPANRPARSKTRRQQTMRPSSGRQHDPERRHARVSPYRHP